MALRIEDAITKAPFVSGVKDSEIKALIEKKLKMVFNSPQVLTSTLISLGYIRKRVAIKGVVCLVWDLKIVTKAKTK